MAPQPAQAAKHTRGRETGQARFPPWETQHKERIRTAPNTHDTQQTTMCGICLVFPALIGRLAL